MSFSFDEVISSSLIEPIIWFLGNHKVEKIHLVNKLHFSIDGYICTANNEIRVIFST